MPSRVVAKAEVGTDGIERRHEIMLSADASDVTARSVRQVAIVLSESARQLASCWRVRLWQPWQPVGEAPGTFAPRICSALIASWSSGRLTGLRRAGARGGGLGIGPSLARSVAGALASSPSG